MYFKIAVSINAQPLHHYHLREPEVLIGRSADCGIPLDNAGVSRHHARLVRDGDRVEVEDLGSGNGTFINGQRIDRAPLNKGDELRIGKFTLSVSLTPDAPEADASAEASTPADSTEVADSTVFLRPDETRKILQQTNPTQRPAAVRPSVSGADAASAQQAIWPVFLVGAVLGLLLGWVIWA